MYIDSYRTDRCMELRHAKISRCGGKERVRVGDSISHEVIINLTFVVGCYCRRVCRRCMDTVGIVAYTW